MNIDDIGMSICSAKCPLLEYAIGSDEIFLRSDLFCRRKSR